MALKDLMVHVDRSQAGMTRMRLAADLAARHGARLTVLHVKAHSINQEYRLKTGEMGLASAAAAGADLRSVEREHDRDSTLLQALLLQLEGERQLKTEWCEAGGSAARIVVQRSRQADLTIVGHDLGGDADLPNGYSFAESVLFQSGRPLIIVPPEVGQTTLGREVAIAWNGSRPAARALSDALPLVERAERTTVLIVTTPSTGGPEALPATDILPNIGRHAAHIEVISLARGTASTGDLLQSEALSQGADLLVAGAYGQPRLWEKMLGGTTRDMLARMRMPILMSH